MQKAKVKLSTYSLIVTVAVTGVLIGSVVMLLWKGDNRVFIVVIILLLLLLSAFLYGPLTISADDNAIVVKSIMKKHRLPVSKVHSVELFRPTMGSLRLFGSGGYLGYWGIFREGDIGRYMAYYGKASDCFLVRMKNGDKYVLGCENPEKMVDYLNTKIN